MFQGGGIAVASRLARSLKRRRAFDDKFRGRRKRRRINKGAIALREVNKLKAQRETKTIFENSVLTIPGAGTAQIESDFIPVQGTSQTTRLGDKITIHSVSGRIEVVAAVTESEGTIVRVMYIYDRRPLGALAVAGDILQTAGAAITNSLYQSQAAEVRGRFQILYDHRFIVGGAGSIGVSEQAFDKFFIKRTFKMEFNGNVGSVADIEKGNFILMCMSDGRHTAGMIVNYNIAYKFTDS